MQLPSYVKPKPRWWCFIPWLSGTATVIGTRIYLPRKTYRDFFQEHPSPFSIATLEHELVHRRRQIEIGIVRFSLQYVFFRSFRFREEIFAIREQMAHLKNAGEVFNINARARELSSWVYLWAASYKRAKAALEKLWIETPPAKTKTP